MSVESLFDEIFSDNGLLSQSLTSFESREGQVLMAKQIWEAFEDDKIALIEAGTGIGKSLAYLIPAILWSQKTGEKIVVSTQTINLQQQLMEKDIPFLLEVLGVDLKVVLVKGMSNYLCKRKLEDFSNQEDFLEETDQILSWSERTLDGTRSDISFPIKPAIWKEIGAESENCPYLRCPHYKQCFFFKARNKLADSDILIVNHHLLMAHLLSDENRPVLPAFSHLIVDEAHHLEPVSQNALIESLDQVEMLKVLARVHSDHHKEVSRFFYLDELLNDRGQEQLQSRLRSEMPAEKKKLLTLISYGFDLLHMTFASGSSGPKWRLTEQILQTPIWKDEILVAFEKISEGLKRFGASLDAMKNDIEALKLESLKEKLDPALYDLAAVATKIEGFVALCEQICSLNLEGHVLWAEKKQSQVLLSCAKLGVSEFLEKKLFKNLKSAVLCSATLTDSRGFDYVSEKVGLTDERKLTKSIYPSDFDYKNRTRLLIPKDIPLPNDYTFTVEASQLILEAIIASGGGAFVLFTSHSMLNQFSEILEQPCFDRNTPLLCQGDLPRHQLLESFKEQQHAVLLGTDSFWEGVDVVGNALRLVIVVKLPFPVPSDPLTQARSEKLKKEGRDPFSEDSVPQAVMKFKQGFGRLMRSSTDRGCILCLDQRLKSKGYGRSFLASIPDCVTIYDSKKFIVNEMRNFYKN